MSPPQLPGDAPVANIPHPLKISIGPVGRDKLRAAGFDSSNCFLSEGLDPNEPLDRQQRLDDRSASLAVPNLVLERFGAREQTQRFEILQNAFPRLVAIESLIDAA